MKDIKTIPAAFLLATLCLAMTSVSCDKGEQTAPDSNPVETSTPDETSKPAPSESTTDSTPVDPVTSDEPTVEPSEEKPADSPLEEEESVTSNEPTVEPSEEKPADSPSEESVTIDEPGFEADGTWKFGQTGVGVRGFFGKSHLDYINGKLIDKVPNRGIVFAYNNGPQHDLYQVLTATLAAKTTYKLSVVAIDATFADPFPGGKLRLGYVPKVDDGLAGDGVANDFYGEFLLTPTAVTNPTPANDAESDDGYETWTWTFTTGATPVGLGEKLRIEILGGGKVQSIFDNVHLEASAAAPGEIENAANAISAATSTKTTPVLVMLGDSTTVGGMPKAVRKELIELIPSELQRPKVINAGKGGDNATNAFERLEKDVLAHKPNIVTVSFGLNDVHWRDPDEFKNSLKKIIETLHDADIQVVLLTSTPFNNERHGWGKQFEEVGGLDEYMDTKLCEQMRSLADGKEILLCDLHTIFKTEFKKDPEAIDKVISTDGVHLTAEGNALAAKHIAPVIHKLLTKE